MSGSPTQDGKPGATADDMHVLLVEDTEINQFVATRMLKKLGCSVDVACDGVQGVAKAAERAYAVILMDCSMPRMDGYEATRRIRAGGGPNAETPIIAVTANGRDGARERCFEAGMDAFLEKPMDHGELLDALSRAAEGALRR